MVGMTVNPVCCFWAHLVCYRVPVTLSSSIDCLYMLSCWKDWFSLLAGLCTVGLLSGILLLCPSPPPHPPSSLLRQRRHCSDFRLSLSDLQCMQILINSTKIESWSSVFPGGCESQLMWLLMYNMVIQLLTPTMLNLCPKIFHKHPLFVWCVYSRCLKSIHNTRLYAPGQCGHMLINDIKESCNICLDATTAAVGGLITTFKCKRLPLLSTSIPNRVEHMTLLPWLSVLLAGRSL